MVDEKKPESIPPAAAPPRLASVDAANWIPNAPRISPAPKITTSVPTDKK